MQWQHALLVSCATENGIRVSVLLIPYYNYGRIGKKNEKMKK